MDKPTRETGSALGRGALRACSDNGRYFTDDSGRAIYLVGSQTWATLQERRMAETPLFDYEGWLDFLERQGHNYFRLWTWEHSWGMQFSRRDIRYYPNWYERTGPGLALDGKPKFDLQRLNDYLFARLRDRVIAAGERGFYVSVMFFQGFSLDKTGRTLAGRKGDNAFRGHPMHRENNINGIDGDPDGNGTGHQVHTLDVAAITALQERFVSRVVGTLGDLDNVLWEVTNESHIGSVDWQYHIVDFVHDYERGKPKQHPIGMSGAPIRTESLLASNADWIAPYGDGRPAGSAPPPMDGSKVVIADTDHIGALTSTPSWVWRCMLNGHNFSIMDPYMDARYGSPRAPHTEWEELRRQAGFSRLVAARCDLNNMVPMPELSSSGYCLANPGDEYLVYLDQTDSVEVDLTAAPGELACTWFDVETGEFESVQSPDGNGKRRLTAPGKTRQLVHIRKT